MAVVLKNMTWGRSRLVEPGAGGAKGSGKSLGGDLGDQVG